jgi:nucleoside phosphorylase
VETPLYDNTKQKKLYRENSPGNPPQEGSPEYTKLMKFSSEVGVILHTVNKNEYQAAVIRMEPPGDGFTKAIQNFPKPGMVVGMFAGKKVALIQTSQGIKSREKLDKALESFLNAMYIIAVGVCYAFDRNKYKLGDVIVSTKISDFANPKYKRDGRIEDRGETIDIEGFLSDAFCLNPIHDPEFEVTSERESDVHSGRFLSHPALMDNKTERDKFHAAAPNAIGGEMEGGVLMQVKKEEKNSIRGIIVIKGVVDYADGDKEKQWQFTAALAAVHYTKSKLSAINLPPQSNSSICLCQIIV